MDFSSPTQASFFLICGSDSTIMGYHQHVMQRPEHHFYTDVKLFQLICIGNDFPKHSAKYHNLLHLFKYFVLHITIVPQNDTLLYHRTNQTSLKYFFCIILQNAFLAPEIVNNCLFLQFAI